MSDSDGFRFEVQFLGLTALVPWREPNDQNVPGEYVIVLPALESGLQDDRLPRVVPPHVGAIVVDRRFLKDPDDSGAQLEFSAPAGTEPVQQMFKFDFEKLELEYESSRSLSAEQSILTEEQIAPDDPGSPGPHDLAWVPSLARSRISGASTFDQTLLLKNRVPSQEPGKGRVGGSVIVDSGTLACSGVVQLSRNRGPAVYEFGPTPENVVFRQAVFQSLVWSDQVPSGGVVLELADELGTTRRIELEPQDGEIRLSVQNRELEQIVGVGKEVSAAGPGAPDPDFATSYWLSKAWDGLREGEAIVPHAPRSIAGGSEPCKNGGFRGRA